MELSLGWSRSSPLIRSPERVVGGLRNPAFRCRSSSLAVTQAENINNPARRSLNLALPPSGSLQLFRLVGIDQGAHYRDGADPGGQYLGKLFLPYPADGNLG